MKRLFTILIILFSFASLAQDSDHQLAEHYYSQDEFSKAIVYYRRLSASSSSAFYFNRLIECLTEVGEDKEVEKLLKKQIAKNKTKQEYRIQLAKFYENHEEKGKADKIYDELIDNLRATSRDVIDLYNAFKSQGKSDMSYQTLLKGRKLLKKSYPLNFQFAEYYGSNGQTENMMNEYLDLLDYHPSYISSLQRILSNQINFSEEESAEFEILKKALIDRTQKNPSEIIYSEMLTWLFIQRQNFNAALVHVKAIDKRTKSKGNLVFDLGLICVENKNYTVARKSFQYVVGLGETATFYLRAQNALLNVRFLEITTLRNFSSEELDLTIEEYNVVLNKFGKSRPTLPLILELAHIQAFYANKGQDAISMLDEALDMTGLSELKKADVKMLLADIHVLHGDVWEASLLYMQVDKSFKYESIGHEAKFKNARIFYYDGEFDFAQSQLDVLKQSTTKLIANDALKLSLLITDNYGLDSNYIAMNWFANADLLIEQHRYEEAFVLFDSIVDTYPAHSLGDEILLKKSKAMQLQGKWNEAIKNLEELLKYFDGDILADDALFQLGDIFENRLMDGEKAAQYYSRILFDYKGSLYTEEARKRFRKLREIYPAIEG